MGLRTPLASAVNALVFSQLWTRADPRLSSVSWIQDVVDEGPSTYFINIPTVVLMLRRIN
jgi:hypothetical protein